MMLGGMMFPVENMPHWVQVATLINPVRHYLVVVRGVFLRGAGWSIVMPQLIALSAIGAVVLGFATARFRKTAM